LIARLTWLELRQQVGGRVFWIVFAVSMLMVGGAMAIDELRVGLPAEGARTGAAAIVRTHMVWSLFFLFTAAALVGEAVLRDRTSGFAELVDVTPVHPRSYALGRFVGATGALLLCFLSVPAAMVAGGIFLGHGTGAAGSYAVACFGLALPNLLLASSLFFALSLATRSMTGCLLGAAGLLTIYVLAGGNSSAEAGLAEPFGFAAVRHATSEWDAVRLDTNAPPLAGVLLANRLLWLGVAAALVGLGVWLSGRGRRQSGRRPARPAGPTATPVSPAEAPTLSTLPAAGPRPSTVFVQLWWQTRFQAGRVVRTPAFGVLLLLGLVNAAAAGLEVSGTPATIESLVRSFQLVPVVVVLFFAGELFWAERETGMAPIVSATPVSHAVPLLAKLLALVLVLLSLAAASAGAGAATELVTGGVPAPVSYLFWYVLPQTFDWVLLGVLALFLQSVAPNKLAGWGYMVFYLIGSLALNQLGWQDPHYRYGSYPGAPLPPALSGKYGVAWYQFGWGMVASVMMAMMCRPISRNNQAA